MVRTSIRAFNFYGLAVFFILALALLASVEGIHYAQSLYRKLLPEIGILEVKYPVAVGKDGPRNIYKFIDKRPASWRSLHQISRKAVAAILTSEDGSFFQHEGYDAEAIRKAWEENQRAGKIKRGGSTITQQVIKNLFLTPEKTLSRKARELLLAVELEKTFTKRQILETYLNIAEWGPRIYGIQQASEHYFGKNAGTLTAREGAILAFLLPNPKRYQSSYHDGTLSSFGARRVASILERLWRTGQISDEEYASAGAESTLPSRL